MRLFFITLCLIAQPFAHTFSHAQLPVVGEPLTAISIGDLGSIELQGDEMVYQPWSTSKLLGTTVYLQYMAARSSASELNKHVDDAVEGEGYSTEQVLSVAIANKDDALWGTGAFVAGELKKNKRRYPDSIIVADSNGLGRDTWQLEEKGAAVIILSAQGSVLFFRQGLLNSADVAEVLQILADQVGS